MKSFWDAIENAVKMQVYTAVITYPLVTIIRQRLNIEYPSYKVLQILGSSLLDKTPINQLLEKLSDQDVKELLYNKLKIFYFKRGASDTLSLIKNSFMEKN